MGQPLATQPELANDPTIAGAILAQFLKNKETAIKSALAFADLALARKLVNGGSHGLDRFTDTYNRGLAAIPG
jgi:predicted chitinase